MTDEETVAEDMTEERSGLGFRLFYVLETPIVRGGGGVKGFKK